MTPTPPAATGRTVHPGRRPGQYLGPDGATLAVPEGWALLPPGDAMLTRRVKAGGDHWLVVEQVGRRLMSRGVLAPADRIERCRRGVEREKASPTHARKLALDAARRATEQAAYVRTFERAVLAFLAFPPSLAGLAARLAQAIAAHATPVGAGTVARTERIPVEARAEAAVIAWLRHQTTAYDDLHIPRVRGLRREVRQQLAARSRALLVAYRRGAPPTPCILEAALQKVAPPPEAPEVG